MKEKEVVIDIHSVHAYDQEDTESLDFTTDGLYHFKDGVGHLWYWESEVTGLPGTRTSVEIGPDGVVVDRKGTVTSRMEFKAGMKYLFPYETPYGMASMGVDTRKIRASFDEKGGEMELDYVLNLEHTVAVRNKFQIKVREQTGENTYG